MFLQGTVFDPSAAATADGVQPVINMGRANEALVAELHGKYFTQNYRGNVFIGSTNTTGAVIPIATTLTPTYTIWNPTGSGKLCVPIVTLLSWGATVGALGGLVWTATTGAGATISATAPFTAFTTPGTPVSANLGGPPAKASVMKFGNQGTTITLVAAASLYRSMGITIVTNTAAANPLPYFTMRDDWDGMCIIPPGNAIHLMGTAAVAITATISTVWAEVPL